MSQTQTRYCQDLTACVQDIRRDQAASRRNQAYLVVFVLLLWAALGTLVYASQYPTGVATIGHILLLLAAALTAGVLLAWPK